MSSAKDRIIQHLNYIVDLHKELSLPYYISLSYPLLAADLRQLLEEHTAMASILNGMNGELISSATLEIAKKQA